MDGRPRQLRRSNEVDWPTLHRVMRQAVLDGRSPFAAARELCDRLFSNQRIAVGFRAGVRSGFRVASLDRGGDRAAGCAMKLRVGETWQEKIRRNAVFMLVVVGALALVVPGIVIVDRLQMEKFLEFQDDYHLTSALAATSAELEIAKILLGELEHILAV